MSDKHEKVAKAIKQGIEHDAIKERYNVSNNFILRVRRAMKKEVEQ
jgi:hypothetical protein